MEPSDQELINTMKNAGLTSVVACIAVVGFLILDGWADEFRYELEWESIRNHYEVPDWFRDAKFGIFLHWGPYAVPAYMSEKYAPGMYDPGWNKGGMNAFRHHQENYGGAAKFGYKDFVPMFKAEKFDTKQWAEMFKQAGARYVVQVAEHHDGFAMYASKHTRWNARDMGPKQDVMRALADACRAEGMKFGASSHFALNRIYYKTTESDWDTNDPQYADLYWYEANCRNPLAARNLCVACPINSGLVQFFPFWGNSCRP